MFNKHFLSHIMNGITHILPLLIVSGILVTVQPLFSEGIQTSIIGPIITFLWMILFPIFSAFLMFSMVDRPGFVPGLVIGFLVYHFGLGYLSLLLFSFMMSYVILRLKKSSQNLILSFKSTFSMIIIPLITILISVVTIYFWQLFIGPYLNIQLPYVIVIPLSILLSAMMNYDFGGPINKIAFLIGVISLSFNEPSILMASVMVGGMVAPLGIALSRTLTPKLFNEQDKKKATLNYINGFLFITEGALSFMQEDTKVKRLWFMIASGISGLIIALFKTKTIFPHGGILVIPFMEQWLGFLLALVAGTLISALSYCVIIKKKPKEI